MPTRPIEGNDQTTWWFSQKSLGGTKQYILSEESRMKKFLFTTLPSNDLGLLTRSLPIARELRDRGHEITFCSPGKTPNQLISNAGFSNLLPEWPLFYIMSGDTNFQSFYRLLRSKHLRRDCRLLVSFLRHMLQSSTAEIWDIDHFMYMLGMCENRGRPLVLQFSK